MVALALVEELIPSGNRGLILSMAKMNGFIGWLFVVEVRNQAEFALYAYEHVESLTQVSNDLDTQKKDFCIALTNRLRQDDPTIDEDFASQIASVEWNKSPGRHQEQEVISQIFFYLHSFLTHVGNISKLFWCPRAKNNTVYEVRGDWLRDVLDIRDPSCIRDRHLRDALEHYDERLDDWFNQHGAYMRMDFHLGSALPSWFPPEHRHRAFDPDTNTFSFMGQEFPLTPLVAEIRGVLKRAKKWEDDTSIDLSK